MLDKHLKLLFQQEYPLLDLSGLQILIRFLESIDLGQKPRKLPGLHETVMFQELELAIFHSLLNGQSQIRVIKLMRSLIDSTASIISFDDLNHHY